MKARPMCPPGWQTWPQRAPSQQGRNPSLLRSEALRPWHESMGVCSGWATPATLYYGMERWRFQAHCFAASGIVVHFYQSEDEQDQERSQQCFDAWQIWETRLLSIDAAVEAVCSKHGVDVEDVRRMAGFEGPYQVLGLGVVDPELVAEMTQSFDNVLQPK